jgi:xanthine/CO dehydrogenase XdhC/CoxF family maturation factor
MTDWLTEASALAARGEPFAIATVVRCARPTSAKPGAKALIRSDGSVSGWIGGSCAEPVAVKEALNALEDGEPRFLVLVGPGGAALGRADGVREYTMTCHSGGTLEIFVEPVLPKPALVLVGSGPVIETLAVLAAGARFAVTVEPESAGSPPRRRPPCGEGSRCRARDARDGHRGGDPRSVRRGRARPGAPNRCRLRESRGEPRAC